MIRVGILGYGFAGRGFHAYLLRHEPRLKLTAVATRDPGRRAQAELDHGVETFETLTHLLASESTDLVILATPHAVHAAQAVAVLDAGQHCVTDKVMCLTAAEADAMIAARDRSGKVLSVFHNRRWDGDFLTVKRVLEQQLLGEVRFLETGNWRWGPPRTWRGTKTEMGSLVHDWGAHFVDQMFQLLPGEVVKVQAVSQHDWESHDIESFLSATLTFASGVVCRLEINNRCLLPKPHWYCTGSRGGLVKYGVDPQEAAMLQGDIHAAVEDPTQQARLLIEGQAEQHLPTVRGDWTAFYRNLADVLSDGAELIVKPEEAARGVRLLAAIETAANQGETLKGCW